MFLISWYHQLNKFVVVEHLANDTKLTVVITLQCLESARGTENSCMGSQYVPMLSFIINLLALDQQFAEPTDSKPTRSRREAVGCEKLCLSVERMRHLA